MSDAVPKIYTNLGLAMELRQSEIISGLTLYKYNPLTSEVTAKQIEYSILASQDCDLLRDYEDRQGGRPSAINGVLLYELEEADQTKNRKGFERDIWKRIQPNNHERFHYLQKIPENCDLLGRGLPDFLVDFRRFFTIEAAEVERQCATDSGAKRRCMLETPYKEHFQARAAFYLSRVSLPTPHASVD